MRKGERRVAVRHQEKVISINGGGVLTRRGRDLGRNEGAEARER